MLSQYCEVGVRLLIIDVVMSGVRPSTSLPVDVSAIDVTKAQTYITGGNVPGPAL